MRSEVLSRNRFYCIPRNNLRLLIPFHVRSWGSRGYVGAVLLQREGRLPENFGGLLFSDVLVYTTSSLLRDLYPRGNTTNMTHLCRLWQTRL